MADAGYGRSSARHRRAQPPARPVVWPPLPLPGAEILDRNSSYRSWVAPFTPFSRRLARGASVTRGGHPFRVSVSVAEALLSWSDNRHVVLACDLTRGRAAVGQAGRLAVVLARWAVCPLLTSSPCAPFAPTCMAPSRAALTPSSSSSMPC